MQEASPIRTHYEAADDEEREPSPGRTHYEAVDDEEREHSPGRTYYEDVDDEEREASPTRTYYEAADDEEQNDGPDNSSRDDGSMSNVPSHKREMRAMHHAYLLLESRCLRLEDIVHKQETRLQSQEEERIKRDYEINKTKNEYEKQIKNYEETLTIRHQQFLAEKEKSRRAQRELQQFHRKKHEMVAQAIKDDREARKDQERAAAQGIIRRISSGIATGNSGSNGNLTTGGTAGGARKCDAVLRLATPSNALTRTFFSGAGGGEIAQQVGSQGNLQGGRKGPGSGLPSNDIAEQRRKAYVENILNEFFML